MVLQFHNSSVFELLHRIYLRNLTKKVLFLVSLATPNRVGVLQAVSRTVSFVRSDACLCYVLEFVTKTEFISNPFPRSFLVASLSDFAAGLDDELLLYLSVPSVFLLNRTSFFFSSSSSSFSVPWMPFSGFVEDCHFFIPSGGILGTGAARLEVGSVGAHSVRGVSTLAAFHMNW